MQFEVEFHPVGEKTKAGDAITIRYWVPGERDGRVMVVDGGTDESGERLVDHIRTVYGPGTIISDVVNTHPDTDHACGLRAVLREFPVERLWVHGLYGHAAEMVELFESGRWTAAGLERRIRDEYPVIEELHRLAEEQGAEIREPFFGELIGPFTVLSPRPAVYRHLVPQFRKTPDPDVELLKQRKIWLDSKKGWLYRALDSIVEAAETKIQEWVAEHWSVELLKEGGKTAAENESSVVMVADFGSAKVLLTGDAGVNALHWSMDNAQELGIDLSDLALVQVPHHGSRSNVSPSVLDRLLGPPRPQGTPELRKAVVSAPKDDEKHPRKMVVNAFTRRGAGVRTTQGVRYRFHSGLAREGEKAAEALPFFSKVEAYD